MYQNRDYLFRDPDYRADPAKRISYVDTLDIFVEGAELYGEIYVPGEIYERPLPTVLLVHGFPGIVSSDDLAQALCRAGFLVMRMNHRGAWNSEGSYAISGCVTDAITLAKYAASERAERYGADPERIFFCGHSMGGNTVLQATRALPWIRGTIMMAPYDLAYAFTKHEEQSLRDMIASSDGRLLRLNTEEEQNRVFQDAEAHWETFHFTQAVQDMKDRNLLMIGGILDQVAPVQEMIEPLWTELEKLGTAANHRKVYLPGDHGFQSCRIALIETIADWLLELI